MHLPCPIRPLLAAIHEAGEAILDVYARPFEVWDKADHSPLTAADKAAHEILWKHLTKAADLPVLSEEGRDIPCAERRAWRAFWLVDPLDGTKEFIKKNGEFTVNVALVEGERPVFGIIYVPVTGVCYAGMAGAGAWRMETLKGAVDKMAGAFEGFEAIADVGTRLPSVTGRPGGRPLMVVGSRSHQRPEMATFVEEMKRIHPRVELVASGSSLKFCRVAEGAADVYPRFGPTMEWDTGAGDAIVSAAGGGVWQMATGAPLVYNKKDLLNPFFVAEIHPHARGLFEKRGRI